MPLSAGAKIGPYEILAPLGAGGMGEVYRARDSRLNRDVAIKILPPEFAGDPNRMARFQREAQALAALNHPHIAAIYGVEESAIVMELVEGNNLAGPVPIDDAIAIARQIAEALDAAHQKNIIHRDLKPGNIKITPEGSVKVLDFGLAKAFDVTPTSADSPTFTMDSTRAGVILGTAGYMSPEQARGKAVDRRADIWSFGVVFYELLTGHRVFEGETVSDTLAGVLKTDPDWARLPAGTPVGVRRLLERCLQRDPNKRLRDIGDAWIEMDRPAEAPPRLTQRSWIPWVVGLAIAVALGAWGWLRAPVSPPRTVTHSAMTLSTQSVTPALSHDGTRLAYAEIIGDHAQLMLRMMDHLEGKPIPGGAGASPEFSPDGQWIAYVSASAPAAVKKIPVTGGTPITLCELPSGNPFNVILSWGADDTILFGTTQGVMRVPSAGGAPQQLTTVNTKSGESEHDAPQLLPGGQTILFTLGHAAFSDSNKIAALDLKSGATRVLVNSGYSGRYVPSGHLVYVRGGTLFAVPFDPRRLEVMGPETPVVDGVSFGYYSFSDTSLLVFWKNSVEKVPAQLEWTDRKGVAQPLSDPPRAWGMISVSPNGKLVAGSIRDNGSTSAASPSDIWIYDLERRTLTRMTFEGFNYQPIWTPDGRWVTFTSNREGKYGLYRVPADKSGPPELLLTADDFTEPASWTPDGKTLLYSQRKDGKVQIWSLEAPGSGGESKPRLFSRSVFNEDFPALSPDGKWVAYTSDESGKFEAYVEPFPGPGGRSQISTQGGFGTFWSRRGRELYYVQPGSMEMMVVDVAAGPVFRAGSPQALFKVTGSAPVDVLFDPTPDPERFLVGRLPERTAASTFVVITDWFEDLRRKAPVKK